MNLRCYHIVFAWLLLLASSLPIVFPATLMVQRAFAVHEMKEKLERKELQEVRVPRSSIQWVKAGKECMINNRMFDVKDQTVSGDSVVLRGLYDDKEKEIIARMESVSTPLHQDQERSNTIYQITHLVFDCNELPLFSIRVPMKNVYAHCPPSTLCLRFSAPPYAPPERV
jgi:hypothetical protein